MPDSFATDSLLFNGREYARGDKLELDEEQRDHLLETGQISASKPKAPKADSDGDGVSDAAEDVQSLEELLAEARDNISEADNDDLVEFHEVLSEIVEVLRDELVDRELIEEPEEDEPGAVTLPAIDYSELSKPTLQELAAQRKLEVTRTDDKKGDLRVEDYAAALVASDEAAASDDDDS
jgi:hypothetical protein